MPKKKVIKYPELDLRSGIVVRTTRSGILHAVFFDPHNDYCDLLDALIYLCKSYIPDIDISQHCEESDTLYIYIQDWLNKHDQGSLNIVKNEY